MLRLSLILLLLLSVPSLSLARKVRQSLKITKEKTDSSKSKAEEEFGREMPANEDSYIMLLDGRQALFSPDSISFAGYEKEANASIETFLVVNSSPATLSAIKVKIVYTDLQDRMLHSRTVSQTCFIPPHESRRIDIKAWDKQHTYFYYLGNEPRKVATPYKIQILPLAFFIKD